MTICTIDIRRDKNLEWILMLLSNRKSMDFSADVYSPKDILFKEFLRLTLVIKVYASI